MIIPKKFPGVLSNKNELCLTYIECKVYYFPVSTSMKGNSFLENNTPYCIV